jgi:hypothetical protein
MGNLARTLATWLALLALTVLARPDAWACVQENLAWAEGVHGTYVMSVDADFSAQCAAVDGAWIHIEGSGQTGLFRDATSGVDSVDPVTVRFWILGVESGDWIQASWSYYTSGPIDVWLHLESLDGPTPADLLVQQPIRIGVALNDEAMAGCSVVVEPVVDLSLAGLHAGAPVAAEQRTWGGLKASYR